MSKTLIYREYLIVILAGIIIYFSFAPYNFYFLGFISIILLLRSVENSTFISAAMRTYLYGLSLYGVGCLHIYTMLNNFVHNTYIASMMYFALVAFLATYPCLKICIYKCYKGSYLQKALMFSSIWIVVDWARERIFTGFPYLNLGYSLVDTKLAALSPIISVYGLSWIIIFISSLMYFAYSNYKNERHIPLLITTLVGVVIISSIFASNIKWTHRDGTKEDLILVQGNMPIKDYWNPQTYQDKISIYENLTQHQWKNKTIIWPENSITLPSNYGRDILNKWDNHAKHHNSTLILGIPKSVASVELLRKNYFYNQVIAIGAGKGYYYKNKLVPWAEYIPWGNLGQFIAAKINIPEANMFSDASDQATFNVLSSKNINWVPFICYEFYFPSYVINRAQNGNVLLNIVNDGWFGNTNGLFINLQIAQMRALETGRPVVRVANNGITAVISPDGKVVQQLPPFTRGILNTTIFGYQGFTPIMYFGTEWLILLSLVMILLMFLLSVRSNRRQLLIDQYA